MMLIFKQVMNINLTFGCLFFFGRTIPSHLYYKLIILFSQRRVIMKQKGRHGTHSFDSLYDADFQISHEY